MGRFQADNEDKAEIKRVRPQQTPRCTDSRKEPPVIARVTRQTRPIALGDIEYHGCPYLAANAKGSSGPRGWSSYRAGLPRSISLGARVPGLVVAPRNGGMARGGGRDHLPAVVGVRPCDTGRGAADADPVPPAFPRGCARLAWGLWSRQPYASPQIADFFVEKRWIVAFPQRRGTDESVANRCAIPQPEPDGLAPTVQPKIPTSVLEISPQTGSAPRGGLGRLKLDTSPTAWLFPVSEHQGWHGHFDSRQCRTPR